MMNSTAKEPTTSITMETEETDATSSGNLTPKCFFPKNQKRPIGKQKGSTKAKRLLTHPTFLAMAVEAVQALEKHNGATRPAILKYIVDNFDVGNDNKIINGRLKRSLKHGMKNGSLKKSTNDAGTYRIGMGKKKSTMAKKSTTPMKMEPEDTEATTSKKPKSAKSKKKMPRNHPTYMELVIKAIQALKDRKGSSRQAILNYILTNFEVGDDAKVINSRVKVALKRAVKTGTLKQKKGSGASGFFILADKKSTTASKHATESPDVVKIKQETVEIKEEPADD